MNRIVDPDQWIGTAHVTDGSRTNARLTADGLTKTRVGIQRCLDTGGSYEAKKIMVYTDKKIPEDSLRI